MNKISVIIPTKNRMEDIKRCLESISAQTLLPDELVVVDSSDTKELEPKIKRIVNREKIKIRYIHTSTSGSSHQRNIGIEVASGDIIFFFDDDVVLDKKFMKETIDIFDRDLEKKIGAVTGKMVKQNGRDDFVKSFKSFFLQIFNAIFLNYRYGNGKFQPSGFPTFVRSNNFKEVEFLYGAAMALRSEVLTEIKFDESRLGYYFGEDDEFAYRVSRKYKIIYNPHAKFIHNASSSERLNQYARMKMEIENFYFFYRKNLPKTMKSKFAFWWSIVGLFIMSAVVMIVKRDSSGFKGLMAGFINIIRGREYPRS